jgi:CHAT domain-containing protein
MEVGREPPAATLAALSATLLGGLDRRGYPHWTIAPDRRLHYLPFELLALPAGPPERLLVDVAQVSYLPSGAVLGAPRPTGTVAALGLVGFGDPSTPQGGGLALAALGARFDLGSLPGARAELAAAAGEMPGEDHVLLGPDASEAALRDLPPGGASVVHLAAHTLLDESSTRGPAIVLSAGGGEDGLVHPSELAGRPFGGRLAVLAGCQTALGGEADGRALASLTGALLGAGAEGVVATLWRVNDEATAAFMEQFYYYLGRGKSPAAALRLAKLRLRASADWGRPDFWSGFILAGGGGALVAPPSDRLSRLAALGLAVALLAGMAWRSRASRRRRH